MIPESAIDFLSKECKYNQHEYCSHRWYGLGFKVICVCDCHQRREEGIRQVGTTTNAKKLATNGGSPL